MIKQISSFSLQIFGLSVIAALLHWALVEFTALQLEREFLFGTHLFLVVITIIAYTGIAAVWQFNFDITGMVFLVTALLKMFAAVFYLLPVFNAEVAGGEVVILHFFAAYFLYLIFEVYRVVKLLNNRPK